ncbi:MAG: SDR family oxidoreductase [Thermoplasmata archaeon]|nr:SDR family oxidoreductase [Thermoplasmata archaeon]
MDLGLRGKAAIVAAASQGLGKAIAWELAREGARLAICSRDEGRIQATAGAIREDTGAEVQAYVCDLTQEDQIATFVTKAAEGLGGVEVLVTNAGGPPPGGFQEVDDEAWYRTYDLTYLSAVRLIRGALPHMKRGRGGRIVVMTSISVKQPIRDLVLSNAVRLGVVGMAKSLVTEVGPHDITVNVVCPGYVGTARTKELFAARADREGTTPAAVEEALLRSVPLGRMGEPQEVGALVAFLASERAAYLTGNLIQIDGGIYRGVG